MSNAQIHEFTSAEVLSRAHAAAAEWRASEPAPAPVYEGDRLTAGVLLFCACQAIPFVLALVLS